MDRRISLLVLFLIATPGRACPPANYRPLAMQMADSELVLLVEGPAFEHEGPAPQRVLEAIKAPRDFARAALGFQEYWGGRHIIFASEQEGRSGSTTPFRGMRRSVTCAG